MKRFAGGCLFVCCLMVLTSSALAQNSVDDVLTRLSTKDKISQLVIPSYRKTSGANSNSVTTLSDQAIALLNEYSFSGVILYGENIADNDTATKLIHQMQRANRANSDIRPQLLIMADQEGGSVARLAHGTSGISAMALGAANQPTYTQQIAKLIGDEVSTLGINCNLAPVLDVSTDPRNTIVDVRAFSDFPDWVSTHAEAYLAGLSEASIIGCLKHFPGIGNASKDISEDDLPMIVDKTRAELDRCELIPFKHIIQKKLADLVMVGYARYPQLETRTFPTAADQTCVLPAPLSPAIVHDLLRRDLGFNGLVIADESLSTSMTRHLQPQQILQLALEAGTDLIPCLIDLNRPDSVTSWQTAVEAFAAQVEADVHLAALLDAAVKRILTFKQRHGLLEPYSRSDAWAIGQAQTVLQQVSNQANHDVQWSVADQAVTLIANQDQTLPLDPDTSVAILYYYASQVHAIEYGLTQLVTHKQLTAEQAATVKIIDVHKENLLELIKEAKVVVILSTIYFEMEFDPTSPSPYSDEIKVVLPLLASLRERKVKVVVASCHLPYDIGFYYGQVDAIIAGYLGFAMSTPVTTPYNQPRYGAMLPVQIYKLFDRQGDFHGHLPVNIPDVVDGHYQLNSVKLTRGWGLSLRQEENPADDSDRKDDDRRDDDQDDDNGNGCLAFQG